MFAYQRLFDFLAVSQFFGGRKLEGVERSSEVEKKDGDVVS